MYEQLHGYPLRRTPRNVVFLTFDGYLMTSQTPAEHELAQLIVENLNLDDLQPESIDPEAPLFHDGLSLDSIDALELSLAISQRYGVELRSDNPDNQKIFASLRALSTYVQAHKTR